MTEENWFAEFAWIFEEKDRPESKWELRAHDECRNADCEYCNGRNVPWCYTHDLPLAECMLEEK